MARTVLQGEHGAAESDAEDDDAEDDEFSSEAELDIDDE